MRSGIIFGSALALALLLQGCGRKGPLMLPVPQVQQTAPAIDPQKPVEPTPQQDKQP